jgi:hypothetical protein
MLNEPLLTNLSTGLNLDSSVFAGSWIKLVDLRYFTTSRGVLQWFSAGVDMGGDFMARSNSGS